MTTTASFELRLLVLKAFIRLTAHRRSANITMREERGLAMTCQI